jgi:hypothetical protein
MPPQGKLFMTAGAPCPWWNRLKDKTHRRQCTMSSSKKLTCKGTLRQVFIKVYKDIANFLRTFSQVAIVFSTQLFDCTLPCCPSPLLSVSTLPPPPFLMWISVLYTRRQCLRGGGWGSGPQTDKHQPQSPFTGQFFRWRHFALPIMSLIFLRKNHILCYANHLSFLQ